MFLVEQINLFRQKEGNAIEVRHSDILKKIEKRFDAKIRERKISQSFYLAGNGKQERCYELPFEYCLRILMDESETVQDKCVEIMKAQQKEIDRLQVQVPQSISIEDVLIQQLQITKSIRIEQEQIKVRQLEQDERILQIEAKNATSPDYFTIMGYAILKKKKVNVTLAAEIGRKSTAICKQKGYPVEKVRDPRFGYVGSYPTEVLQTVFSAMSFT